MHHDRARLLPCPLADSAPAPVRKLYRGPFPGAEELSRLWRRATAGRDSEGYVVRVARAFDRGQFPTHVGKYVRAQHVQTGEHWLNQELRRNGLRTDSR